jgi:exonuclease III
MVDVTVATFNVNGLRAILARRSTSIAEFLDSLQAGEVHSTQPTCAWGRTPFPKCHRFEYRIEKLT